MTVIVQVQRIQLLTTGLPLNTLLRRLLNSAPQVWFLLMYPRGSKRFHLHWQQGRILRISLNGLVQFGFLVLLHPVVPTQMSQVNLKPAQGHKMETALLLPGQSH